MRSACRDALLASIPPRTTRLRAVVLAALAAAAHAEGLRSETGAVEIEAPRFAAAAYTSCARVCEWSRQRRWSVRGALILAAKRIAVLLVALRRRRAAAAHASIPACRACVGPINYFRTDSVAQRHDCRRERVVAARVASVIVTSDAADAAEADAPRAQRRRTKTRDAKGCEGAACCLS